jgi:hypothetical protein
MLAHLRGRARQWRLFAHACWSRLGHLLYDDRLREFLRVLELHADGRVTWKEAAAARTAAEAATERLPELLARNLREHQVCLRLARWGMSPKAREAARAAVVTGQGAAAWIGEWAVVAEKKAQCDLLREVFGNPFRPPRPDPAWLAWQDGTVPRLARAVYDERRFGDLPVVADALEEAGCADADLLAHLRGPGPHVRGCWAVDALLAAD